MKDTIYISTQVFKDLQQPNNEFSSKDFLFLVGTLLSAFLAVMSGIYLQHRQRIYESKYSVLLALFGERNQTGNSLIFTLKLNQIPMVFKGRKNIIYAYFKFLEQHQAKTFNHEEAIKALHVLIRVIAVDLNYKDLDFSVIGKSFYPKNLEETLEVQHIKNYQFLKEHKEKYINDLLATQTNIENSEDI
jgi:hypothetical protein